MTEPEKSEQTRAIAIAIAQTIGEGWTIGAWHDQCPLPSRTITHPGSGRSFWLRWEMDRADHRKTRITVHANYPKTDDGRELWPREGDRAPMITIAADKTPDQIARDIVRRFLPAYDTAWTLQIAERDRQNDYAAATRRTADALIAAGARPSHHQHSRESVTVYFGSDSHIYSARAEGESVYFERISAPIAAALDIVAAARRKDGAR